MYVDIEYVCMCINGNFEFDLRPSTLIRNFERNRTK